MVRSTEGGRKIFSAIISSFAYEQLNEQMIMNDIFLMTTELFELLLKYGFALDKLLFSNGLVYHHMKWNREFGINPMIVHANWLVGSSSKEKIRALKKEGLWFIDETVL